MSADWVDIVTEVIGVVCFVLFMWVVVEVADWWAEH